MSRSGFLFFLVGHFLQAAHFDGLQADDGSDGGNGLRRVGAGDVGGGLGQAGEDLPVGVPGKDAGEFAGDVAAV